MSSGKIIKKKQSTNTRLRNLYLALQAEKENAKDWEKKYFEKVNEANVLQAGVTDLIRSREEMGAEIDRLKVERLRLMEQLVNPPVVGAPVTEEYNELRHDLMKFKFALDLTNKHNLELVKMLKETWEFYAENGGYRA